jgi:integrase/recombinase XerD
MLGRQAKMLTQAGLRRLLESVQRGGDPERDRVIVLLSVRAGLRAKEIAGLTWEMVLDHDGRIAATIDVRATIAKKRRGRRVPIHPELRRSLNTLRRSLDRARTSGSQPVILSGKGGAMRANSIVNWFVARYRSLGLQGCSSHSGRRTFITNAARRAHKAGASMRDVQMLAGHASIETTQRYIDGDTAAQHKLVALI